MGADHSQGAVDPEIRQLVHDAAITVLRQRLTEAEEAGAQQAGVLERICSLIENGDHGEPISLVSSVYREAMLGRGFEFVDGQWEKTK